MVICGIPHKVIPGNSDFPYSLLHVTVFFVFQTNPYTYGMLWHEIPVVSTYNPITVMNVSS